MKPVPKVNKSPYNPPPVKLRAQIIPEKVQKKKQSSSQSSGSDSDSSSYDSQVQDFANEFYDSAVKKADKSLQLKKDNQTKPQQQKNHQSGNIQSNEDSKIKNAQSELDKISAKLKYLKGNFNDFDMDAILFKKKDQKKLKQIAQFLSKKHKQKKDFMKKMKKIKNSEKQRKKIIEQMKQKKQQQEHNKKMKQIRKLSILIKQKMQKKKQDQQDKLQKIEEFYQNFNKKYKNRKLYKLMEMSDKKKRNKELEEQNQILKQRKQYASQIISAEDIKDFKKRQQELLRDMEKVKQAEKDQKNAELAEKNRELREKIYIGNKYQNIQQEEIRKEKLRQVPKEKLSKIKKYDSYVKQNFLPTKSRSQDDQDSEDKREQQHQEDETVQINGKLYRKIVKDRYLKGQKIGQITCTVPVPQTQRQMKLVGNSYLEQLKHLPKKRHYTSLDLSHKQQVKPKVATSRIQIPKMPKRLGKIILPKNPNRQQLENLIKSLKSKDQLISNQQHYLKVVHKHVNGSNPQKQALDQTLIDNIQKKINLLGRL